MKTTDRPIALHLLGGFELLKGSDRVELSSKKVRGLLAYLALAPNPPVSREKVAALLWPESAEAQARSSLRQALAALRKHLDDKEGKILCTSSEGVSLDEAAVAVDAVELQALVASRDESACLRAAALCRGPLLDGFDVPADPFDTWLTQERARIDELMSTALTRRLETAHQQGDLEEALEVAQKLVSFVPLREDVHRALMRIHRDRGQYNAALKQYEACEATLERELGVSPGPETIALRDEVQHERSAQKRHPQTPRPSGPTSTGRRRLPFAPPQDEGKPSVVVLPFENLGGDENDEYLCDGITEDISTELSRFRELFVISHNSAYGYKGKFTAVQHVGQELSVQYVVCGSIRRSGKRVRLTAQLVDTSDGRHIWAQRYDRELVDVLDLQDELAKEIVALLPGRVQDFEAKKVVRRPPEDMAAYELLLAGKLHHHRFTKEDNQRALALLDRAIALAPNYAAAWAWKGCLYGQAMSRGFMPNPANLLESAKQCTKRALELDENEVESHRILAEVAMGSENLDAARRHNDRAFELNYNDPRLWAQKGELLTWLGDAKESAECLRKAMRLDPYGASMWAHLLGRALMQLGDYPGAIAAYHSCSYDRSGQHADMAACHQALGEAEAANEHAAKTVELTPDFRSTSYVKTLHYARVEDRARHLELLHATALPR